ncbi:glycosyltransferase family 61 protein [Shewanella waksmanii]|uniref:glycosyltransferase family 61 protein n=1 Tax=Shewanella waksmanii TaxID=213783 RepID=UPI0037359FD3
MKVIKEFEDAIESKVKRPLNLTSDINALGFKFRDMVLKRFPLSVYELSNVYLYYDDKGAFFFDSDFELIEELTDSIANLKLNKKDLQNLANSRLTLYRGVTATSVTFKAKTNYCHFLLEGAAKLRLINEAYNGESINNVICDEYFGSQTETLCSLFPAYKHSSFISLKGEGILKFEKLLVTNTIKHPMHNGHSDFKLFFEFLRENIESSVPKKCKRIFIDRPNGRRGVKNKRQLQDLLDKYNFDILKLEDYSFAEQIGIFKEAEVIVGIHGAGLSNLVFSTSKTSVIEVIQHDYGLPSFWFLANFLDLDYQVVGEKRDFLTFNDGTKKFNDLDIDILALEHSILKTI